MHTNNSSSSSVYSRPVSPLNGDQSKHGDDVDIEKQAATHTFDKAAANSSSEENTPRASDVEAIAGVLTSADADLAAAPAVVDPFAEAGDEIYTRFTPRQKKLMVAVLSFTALLAPVSSTTVLSAVPEVASQFSTSADMVNLSNALYLVSMGLSSLFWGPIGQVYGRRWPCMVSAVFFFLFSIGTALSPNLESFFLFRILTAWEGTPFLIVGSSCISDIYRPVERGTALGWFLSGTLLGPALGPLLGGLIVTYCSWRVIFWVQSGLAGAAVVLVCFFLHETAHKRQADELKDLPRKEYWRQLAVWLNPTRVIKLYRYPNLLISAMASSILLWNMYSFLTPIRAVLDPRFNLTTPIQAGLFYLAPGGGYLIGTFFGGRWADSTVKKWKLKRGERIPEDRLRSLLPFMGVVIPVCMVIYGWSIEKAKGGIALPVIVMFLQGFAQLFCFPALNTYCLEFDPTRSADIISGNYCLRYLFGAAGTALVLPAIDSIGVGWFSTISAISLVVMTIIVYINIMFGRGWRERIDSKRASKEDQ